jgi:hypothetical protein
MPDRGEIRFGEQEASEAAGCTVPVAGFGDDGGGTLGGATWII